MSGLLSYLVFFASVVLILGIVTLGLNLQWGFTGLFNAGVVGFYAIGGYTHAILTAQPLPGHLGNLGLPWLAGIAGAMLVTAAAAWLIGIITIRLRADYLAISSFGIAVTIQLVTLNWQALTGGPNGLTRIARPLSDVFDTPAAYNLWYLALLAFITAIVYFGLERMLNSPWGRVLRAIREDELAAVALGKNARRFRLEAFVIGSTLMGLAGALYVGYIGFVSPFDFLPILTFQAWAMLIVGGSGNNRGALLGALVVWSIWTVSGIAVSKLVPPSHAAQGAAVQVILIGLALVLMLLLRPRGLIGERSIVSRHANE
ncbi:MAG: branched-chain amino acid ABC transporter permease [Rhizobacter sp.]|nr:branched-chain amino acid ABC transporter permease [Rhizobacter sp.]